MATINFRYGKDEKLSLEKEALSLGYTSLSQYMIWLIENRNSNISNKNKVNSNTKSGNLAVGKLGKKVETRVTIDEKLKLKNYCLLEKESESAVLLRQIRILLTQKPHFTKDEIQALRLASSQLTAIGRNLNQIVTKINAGIITDSKLSQPYIQQIKKTIDNQSMAIRNLIKKSKDRIIE